MQELRIKIEAIPNVCGGEPCIAGTRIPVWVLEQARRLGTDEDTLLEAYPGLTSDGLNAAWDYVRAHLPEIEAQIRENEMA